MKKQKQDRQDSPNKNRPQPQSEETERSEDQIRHPFDPGWLDRLPRQDDEAYRPWWVVEDPWSEPWPEPSGRRS